MLHGVSATWRVWSPLLPYLEPHHDVFAPTLLGHAGAPTFDPATPLSIDAVTDGVEKSLDRAGVSQAHLVGNSLGGWVAIELARRGRAHSLVLFSPAGASRTQRDLRMLAKALTIGVGPLARAAKHADVIASRKALRAALLFTQVAHPGRVSPDEVAASLRAVGGAAVVPALLDALSRDQVRELATGQPFPVRLVWPRLDRVLPYRRFGAPMAARLPDAELLRVPGVGHVPMSDAPATVAGLILDVTTGIDAATPRDEPEVEIHER
jgi:pimeloyl-ACP methyl ester carboxylesterase